MKQIRRWSTCHIKLTKSHSLRTHKLFRGYLWIFRTTSAAIGLVIVGAEVKKTQMSKKLSVCQAYASQLAVKKIQLMDRFEFTSLRTEVPLLNPPLPVNGVELSRWQTLNKSSTILLFTQRMRVRTRVVLPCPNWSPKCPESELFPVRHFDVKFLKFSSFYTISSTLYWIFVFPEKSLSQGSNKPQFNRVIKY